MDKKILSFCRLLRKNGINISFPQIITAVKAVAQLGFNRHELYHALRCTLITEKHQFDLFDKLFNLYFAPPLSEQEKNEKETAPSSPSGEEEKGDKEQKGQATIDFFSKESKEQVGPRSAENSTMAIRIDEIEFYHLPRPDVTQLHIDEIKKRLPLLARKLATKYSRRYHRAKRGKIDMRKTVKKAFATAAVPLYLKYKVKSKKTPELLVLCDVSKSVSPFSAFMLQLVYSLQNTLHSVRTFLFIDILDEVTGYFLNADYRQALNTAYTRAYFSHTGISDFSSVFSIFADEHCPTVPRRSILIILADARNNGYPIDTNSLEVISEHIGRIIWINPQPRKEWDKNDSVIGTYAPYCEQVLECRNLKQLEEIINSDVIF